MNIDTNRPAGGPGYPYQRLSRRNARSSSALSLPDGLLAIFIGLIILMTSQRSLLAAPLLRLPALAAPAETPAEPASPVATHADLAVQGAALPMPGSGTIPLPAGMQAPVDSRQADAAVKETLTRDRAGNYVTMGAINNKGVRLLVDTGASMVIIPEPLANRIGLKKGKPMTFRTGGGTVTHYATELDSLSIGKIQIRHVPAAINPQMREDFALLGMSALAVMRFSQEGSNLVLSYEPEAKAAPSTPAPQPVRFRRSVRECMGEGKTIDRKTLDCLHGN